MVDKSIKSLIAVILVACVLTLSGCGTTSTASSAPPSSIGGTPSASPATSHSTYVTPLPSHSASSIATSFTEANTVSALESSFGTQFTPDVAIPLWWNGVILADGYFTTDALNLRIMIYPSTGDLQGYPTSLQVMQQMGNRNALVCNNMWIVYPPDIEQRVFDAIDTLKQNLGIICS